MRTGLLVFQTLSFAVLGVLMLGAGETRLGMAQLALGGVNVLVYA